MVMLNPFNPRTGANPHLLVGRDHDLQLIVTGVDFPNSPGSNVVIHGPRGVGKTALMMRAVQEAERRGWEIISTSMRDGLMDVVSSEVDDIIRAQIRMGKKRKTTGLEINLGIFGASVTWENLAEYVPTSFIRKVEFALALLDGKGIMITIDEIQATEGLRDFSILGNDIQILQGRLNRFTKQPNNISFVMAGLSSLMMEVLKDKGKHDARRSLTFLRKAERIPLLSVSSDEVSDAIRWSLMESGRTADNGVIDLMTDAIQGYPFLIQLVGYNVWRKSGINITTEDATIGIAIAKRRLGELVHETALNDLSPIDKTFLLAMSADEHPSKMKDIKTRMGVSDQYGQTYKERLLRADLIMQTDRGRVDYTLPWMREFLREHAAALGISPTAKA